MKTTVKDVIKMHENLNVQFYSLADKLTRQLMEKVKSKKRTNHENFLWYPVPAYCLGEISFDRDKMLKEIYGKIRKRFNRVEVSGYKLYIEWEKKKPKDISRYVFRRIEELIKESARLNRKFCTYTIPAIINDVPIKNIEPLVETIVTELNNNGFFVDRVGKNKLFIYWSRKAGKVPEKDIEAVHPEPQSSSKTPQMKTFETNGRRLNLNGYSPIVPVSTRNQTAKDVLRLFNKEVKRYKAPTGNQKSAYAPAVDKDQLDRDLEELANL